MRYKLQMGSKPKAPMMRGIEESTKKKVRATDDDEVSKVTSQAEERVNKHKAETKLDLVGMLI